ncbi:hypothetical protein H0H87_008562 [Tephrocybe sp. NHM501043]|nr:hypothetical protein H0H87_008562 [Tephrocybe sp. NHM501043]
MPSHRSEDAFTMSDVFLTLKCDSPLESIDNIFDHPLVSLHNIGSLLLAEDEGIPSFYHTVPNFMLFDRHYVTIEKYDSPEPISPPSTINDNLVTLMKEPVELPDENCEPNYVSGLHYGKPDVATHRSPRHRSPSSAIRNNHNHGSSSDYHGVYNTGYSAYDSSHSNDHIFTNFDRHPRSPEFAKPHPQPFYVPSLPPLSPSQGIYSR